MTRVERSRSTVAARPGRAAVAARRRRVAWLVAGILLASAGLGCSSAARVKTKSATAVDVSFYRTYEWGTPAPVVVADEERERDAAVLEWTIRHATDQQLAAKGYRHIDAGASPDFLVDFGVRLEEKSTDTFGEYITYRDLGGKQGMGPAYVFGYEEGTLVLEITDVRTRERAWSGSSRTVLDDGQDVTKLEASIGRILASFPNAGGVTPAQAAGAAKASEFGAVRPPEP